MTETNTQRRIRHAEVSLNIRQQHRRWVYQERKKKKNQEKKRQSSNIF